MTSRGRERRYLLPIKHWLGLKEALPARKPEPCKEAGVLMIDDAVLQFEGKLKRK